MSDRTPKIRHAEALEMYHDGATDVQIAAHFGAAKCTVQQWRTRHGLPSIHWCGLPAYLMRKARKMLREGASKQQVADEMGVSKRTVQVWRRKMPAEGMRRPSARQRNIRESVVNDNELYPRILRAVGVGLPRDVRHDAANALYVDVLTGRLAVDLIEVKASRYRSMAWEMDGSAFGPISLDAANDDGFSLADLIADPAALEAMDDAAERAWGQGKMLV